MKLLVPCFVALALAACGSSTSPTTTSGTGTTGGTTTGGKSGSSTGGSTTGPAGTTTGIPLGQPCTLDSSGDNSCQAFGLECSADLTGQAGNGTCILPENLTQCDQTTSYGCQDGGFVVWTDAGIATDAGVVTDAGVEVDGGVASDGGDIVDVIWVDAGPIEVAATGWVDAGVDYASLVCSSGFVNNSTQESVDVCLQPCTETVPDCPIVFTSCLSAAVPAGCFFNICQTEQPFDACDATSTGAGDGQCYQYFDPTTEQATETVCYQNGSAQDGQPCDPNVRTGTDSECAYSSFCMPNATDDGGLCYPMSPSDGGACPGSELGLEGAASIFGSANFGICVQDCSAGQTCTVGSCQATASGGSVCLP